MCNEKKKRKIYILLNSIFLCNFNQCETYLIFSNFKFQTSQSEECQFVAYMRQKNWETCGNCRTVSSSNLTYTVDNCNKRHENIALSSVLIIIICGGSICEQKIKGVVWMEGKKRTREIIILLRWGFCSHLIGFRQSIEPTHLIHLLSSYPSIN